MLHYQIQQKETSNLAKELFNTYSKSNSGYLSAYEVKNMLKDLYSCQNHIVDIDSHCQLFLNKLDHDKDGRISLSDLEASILTVFKLNSEDPESLNGQYTNRSYTTAQGTYYSQEREKNNLTKDSNSARVYTSTSPMPTNLTQKYSNDQNEIKALTKKANNESAASDTNVKNY